MASLAVLAIAALLSIAGSTSGQKQASECPPCKRIASSNSLGSDWAGLYHLQVFALKTLKGNFFRTLEICAVRWTVVFTGNHAVKSLHKNNHAKQLFMESDW